MLDLWDMILRSNEGDFKSLAIKTINKDFPYQYFGINVTDYKNVIPNYRPATRIAMNNFFRTIHNYNNNFLKNVLDIKRSNNLNLQNIVNTYKTRVTSNKLTKTIPYYYPSLANLINMHETFKSKVIKPAIEGNMEDFEKNNVKEFLDSFIDNINSMNAYFFINYYIYSSDYGAIPSFLLQTTKD